MVWKIDPMAPTKHFNSSNVLASWYFFKQNPTSQQRTGDGNGAAFGCGGCCGSAYWAWHWYGAMAVQLRGFAGDLLSNA
jgi:hypothetical protein